MKICWLFLASFILFFHATCFAQVRNTTTNARYEYERREDELSISFYEKSLESWIGRLAPQEAATSALVPYTWEALLEGPAGIDGSVKSIACDEGRLVAAGHFFSAGGGSTAANGIVMRDEGGWKSFGSGVYSTTTQTSTYPGLVEATAVDGSGRVLVGGLFDKAGVTNVKNIASWDGTSWSSLGSGVSGTGGDRVLALEVDGDTVYAGGYFSKAGDTEAANIAVWNGDAWSPMGSGLDFWVEDISVNNDMVYAVGFYRVGAERTGQQMAYWDGTTWKAAIDSLSYEGNVGRLDAVYAARGSVYVGGLFDLIEGVEANGIARWDGVRWHPLGSGVDSNVWDITEFGDTLIVSGLFRSAGDREVNRIAGWKDGNWIPIGDGVVGWENQFDGRIDAVSSCGKNLFAGGLFHTAGSASANNLASFNGENWNPVGTGADTRARAIHAVLGDGERLYVGGEFVRLEGRDAQNIAVLEDDEWRPLGAGLNGIVLDLERDERHIYAAGCFSSTGESAAYGVAVWNGTEWTQLGEGLNWRGVPACASALQLHDGNLFIGGLFDQAGHLPANNIAWWDGQLWNSLDNGLDGPVYDIVVNTEGIVAAGRFTVPNVSSTAPLAHWIGSSWKYFGEGSLGTAYALHQKTDTLYIGGDFRELGGISSPGVAALVGDDWKTVGAGIDGTALTIADSDRGIVVGGNFPVGGMEFPSHAARWDSTSGWQRIKINGIVNRIQKLSGAEYWGGTFTRAAEEPLFLIGAGVPAFENSLEKRLPAQLDIRIYPNPARDYVYVKTTTRGGTSIELEILDVMGRKVQTILDPYILMRGEPALLDLSGLPSGMYLVGIRIGQEQRFRPFTVVK